MENDLDNAMDEENDVPIPSLSQEKELLKEPMEGVEEENPSTNENINSTMDTTDKKNPQEREQVPIPSENADPNEQSTPHEATSTKRLREESFETTSTMASNLSTQTVENDDPNKKRQRKRPSGAQVQKRRRLAMELKVIQQQQQIENGRTNVVQNGSQETGEPITSIGAEAGGAGNSDTGIQTNVDGTLGSKNEQTASASNQTISSDSSKKKRKRKRQKKNKKNGNGIEIDETIDKASNSNTIEANPSVAGSSSTGEAADVNSAEQSPDAGEAKRDGIGAERQNLSISVSELMNYYGPEKGENYVPASVMVERMRRQARPERSNAYTSKPKATKAKRPESDRIDEKLRLSIVGASDHTAGLSEEILKGMEGRVLEALDAYLDKMPASERPPILVWSGIIGSAYRVDCLDQRAAEWLETTVKRQDFYPGQKLTVVQTQSLKRKKPRLLKVTVWVPGQQEKFEVLTKRIKLLNPTLLTSGWVKFKSEEKDNGQLITFGMPENHLQSMEALECTAFCGTKMIHFRVKKEDKDVNAE